MVYHGPTLLKHKTGFDDYITMSATASSYCMPLWQGTLVGFLGAFIQCFHINQIADGCAHSLCSMPNVRTFMVLKILLGEKKTASPAPLRQQLLQLRLYALPIAALAQLMTTKNACDALQCWTLDLCEQEFRHRNGNHADSSSRHGAAIYKWTPSHTSWNQMPFELRKSESHYEIQAYHLLRKLPEHHQVSARKPSGIPRRICAGIFRNFAPHLHRPPGTS